MKLTVVIPTYNGKAKVKQLLSRLELQSDSGFGVHVLIDGSEDDTYTLKETFPKCHFHVYPNSGRAGIRNRALEHCKEGIIIFLDHDMIPEQELIAVHREFHERNDNSILVGNGFRNPESAKSDFGHYIVQGEKQWIDSHPNEFQVTPDNFVFTACNLSMPAELLASLNGFNTSLRDGEDFELGMRALQLGIKVHYNRAASAWHDDWPTLEQYIRRNSEYLAGKKVLVRLNSRYDEYLKVSAGEKSHNRFKQLIQSIIGRLALKDSWIIRMLPQRLRFIAYRSAIYQFSKA
jgi:glycosyltransferase involved in cell wall biosynthesis